MISLGNEYFANHNKIFVFSENQVNQSRSSQPPLEIGIDGSIDRELGDEDASAPGIVLCGK